jgi:hypothetical protein
VDTRRLCAAQERADVLRILEGVEDEDESSLGPLHGSSEDVVR